MRSNVYLRASLLGVSLALSLAPLSSRAEFVQGDYYYDVADGQATLVGFNYEYTGALSITNLLGGYTVTRIETEAFFWCEGLTSVTIPASVTSIGTAAFLGCTGLAQVTFLNELTTFRAIDVFGDSCGALTSVAIGDSVTEIHPWVLMDDSRLTAFNVSSGNASYSSTNGILFDKSQTRLLQYPGGKAGSYAVPDSVTNIGDWAFAGCAGLTAVTVPASVTRIGERAFSSFTDLFSVTVCGVASLGRSVLSSPEGTGLKMISVDEGNAFYSSTNGVLFNKSQTRLIQYPGGRTGSYAVPVSVTGIGDSAFAGCTGLTSVILSAQVKDIGSDAFAACSGLTALTLPASVTNIGWFAFEYCTGLTSMTIPAGVIDLGWYAFHACPGLASVVFKGNAPNECANAFYQAGPLTVYYFSETTGWGAEFCERPTAPWDPHLPFFYAAGAGKVTIIDYLGSDSVVTVPSTVTGLTVTAIGNCAFQSRPDLNRVTIPASVTNVGAFAFANCANLASVLFKGNAPSFADGPSVFDATPAAVFYLPGTTGWGSSLGDTPTLLWNPQVQAAGFGFAGGRFGFTLVGDASTPVVVEACGTVAADPWAPVETNTLGAAGSFLFTDPASSGCPARFYRIVWP